MARYRSKGCIGYGAALGYEASKVNGPQCWLWLARHSLSLLDQEV
jgi:hypothetical protein